MDSPSVTELVVIGTAVLMVQAGVAKKLLTWRPHRIRGRRDRR
jgi:hypothetical protein